MTQPQAFLRWLEPPDPDLDGYEVRSGAGWMANRIRYRGRAPQCHVPASLGTEEFQVRTRSRSGRFSPAAARLSVTTGIPDGWLAAPAPFPQDEVALAWPGTHDGTEVNADGWLVLQADRFAGTYDTDPLDTGENHPWLWSALFDAWQRDLEFLAADWTDPGDSGFSLDRTGEGMEPTPNSPGSDLETPQSAWAMPADETPGSARSLAFALGHHTMVTLHAAFSDDGVAWSSWSEWWTSFRVARYVKYRLTLRREHPLRYEVQVRKLYLHAAWRMTDGFLLVDTSEVTV